MGKAQQITYLRLSPEGKYLRHLLNPLFLVLCWPVKGTGVGDMLKVLVQVFCEVVYILLLETLAPLEDEFCFWGRHWDEVIGVVVSGDSGVSLTPQGAGSCFIYVHGHVRNR